MLIPVDNFLLLAENEIAKKTKELVKQFHHSVPSLCLADDIELLSEVVDKTLLAKQEEAQVLMSWAIGYYNLIEAPTKAFESVQGLTFEIGEGGAGVVDHTQLTGVDVLTATSTPTGNKAWHIDDIVAAKLIETLYGIEEPELPEGVFWVKRPQGSLLVGDIYTEGESVINAFGAEATIEPEDFTIIYAEKGYRRFDAIVINLTTFLYEYVVGPELDENGIVIYATIPEGTMFVRYIEVNDKLASLPDNVVKGITLNEVDPVLLPNSNGVLNINIPDSVDIVQEPGTSEEAVMSQKASTDTFEPKITPKGTAFNKNFGTTANTVVVGDDPRVLLGAKQVIEFDLDELTTTSQSWRRVESAIVSLTGRVDNNFNATAISINSVTFDYKKGTSLNSTITYGVTLTALETALKALLTNEVMLIKANYPATYSVTVVLNIIKA